MTRYIAYARAADDEEWIPHGHRFADYAIAEDTAAAWARSFNNPGGWKVEQEEQTNEDRI